MIRILLIGCGDVALRTAALLRSKARLYGLTRRAADVPKLRAHGIIPIVGDLDELSTLRRLRAAPFAVLHFAPPPSDGRDDSRTQRLIAALSRARSIPQRFVYISTSGVYGDCAGARVNEMRPRKAGTPRARRRVAAEDRLRDWGRRYGVSLSILRAPGIYAATRLPLERLKQGTPVLAPDEDVFTSHVHADDLARATVAALFLGKPNRAYNVNDDSEMKMGGWLDAVADAFHVPRPPRVSWDEAEQRIAPLLLSFMSESRRLSNERLKRELRVRLKYPTPHQLLAEIAPRDFKKQLSLPLGESVPARPPEGHCGPLGGRRTRVSFGGSFVARLDAYERLIRLDKPIGILLLLWPTLSALWIAAYGRPSWLLVLIFTMGTIVMRSAGCAFNDWADRHFDPHVKRTAERPLATGEIKPIEALTVAAVLAFFAFLIVLPTNRTTILLSLPALAIAMGYPFFKRFFMLPQAFLGIAFSFGIPMAFAAVFDEVPAMGWWMFVLNLFWVMAYDTEYAMVDRDDDARLGLKTSAIAFGRLDVAAVLICYGVYLAGMAGIGTLRALGPIYYLGLTVALGCALWHWKLIRHRERDGCFRAFLHNHWFGLAVFAGIALDFGFRLGAWPRLS